MDRRFGAVTLGGRELPLLVRRRRQRSLTLRLGRKGLVLTLPPGLSEKEGLAFLRSRQDWILDRLDRVPQQPQPIEGTEVSFLGLVLKISDAPVPAARREGDRLLMPPLYPQERMVLLRRFLVLEAQKAFPALMDQARALFTQELPPARLTIRPMESRWGSCSPHNGTIRLSLHLIHYPPELVLAIAAHELNHLLWRGHGAAFWQSLKVALPDCREREAELQRLARRTVHWS